jgi:GNAT superfamily N-acetyltransferase
VVECDHINPNKILLSNIVETIKIVSAVDHQDGWKNVMCKYYEFYNHIPTDEKLEANFAKIKSGEVESRVAILNGEVVAATNFLTHAHTFAGVVCYVNDLIVLPEVRRLGIATKLFAEISKYAESKCCGKIYWNTAPDNPARKLYDNVGYVTKWLKYEINLAASK